MEMGSISIQGGILLLRAFPEKFMAGTLIRDIIIFTNANDHDHEKISSEVKYAMYYKFN